MIDGKGFDGNCKGISWNIWHCSPCPTLLNPYPACALTNLNFQCHVRQVVPVKYLYTHFAKFLRIIISANYRIYSFCSKESEILKGVWHVYLIFRSNGRLGRAATSGICTTTGVFFFWHFRLSLWMATHLRMHCTTPSVYLDL